MRKIGFLGGTFDPIHQGHLQIAQYMLKQLTLNEFYFLPTYAPAHKSFQNITSEVHRVNMIQQALEPYQNFYIDLTEIEAKGSLVYTIDTLKELKRKYANAEIYFVIGGDQQAVFSTWKNPKEITELVHVVSVSRAGYSVDSSYNILSLPMPQIDISSTYIRTQIAKGNHIQELLPLNVEKYIKEHHLYET